MSKMRSISRRRLNGWMNGKRCLAVAAATLAAQPALAHIGVTERVSITTDGGEVNEHCYSSSISPDGRYVAFVTNARNMVPGDTNETYDVFVRDRQTGITKRISVASYGTEGNQESGGGQFSGDGRYVTFFSAATNLVPGAPSPGFGSNVFVHDQDNGRTERVSTGLDGSPSNCLSGWYDSSPISADGRYVAFSSCASNLVPGDTNGLYDVFVRDRKVGKTELVSVASDGTQGARSSWRPSISADCRYVAFVSDAANLVPDDKNGSPDIFVHDRLTRSTRRASVASDGPEANASSDLPVISDDGRYVVFTSEATNLVDGDTNEWQDIFVHDRQTGITERANVGRDGGQANDWTGRPAISGDGRYIAFDSFASNLVTNDTNDQLDVFVRARKIGTTERVSIGSDRAQGNDTSFVSTISGDGRYVAFSSQASNLVPGDTNEQFDVFVRDRGVARALKELMATVQELVEDGLLTAGQGSSLTGKLAKATASLRQRRPDRACGSLGALVNQAIGLALGDAGQPLIEGADTLRRELACA